MSIILITIIAISNSIVTNVATSLTQFGNQRKITNLKELTSENKHKSRCMRPLPTRAFPVRTRSAAEQSVVGFGALLQPGMPCLLDAYNVGYLPVLMLAVISTSKVPLQKVDLQREALHYPYLAHPLFVAYV